MAKSTNRERATEQTAVADADSTNANAVSADANPVAGSDEQSTTAGFVGAADIATADTANASANSADSANDAEPASDATATAHVVEVNDYSFEELVESVDLQNDTPEALRAKIADLEARLEAKNVIEAQFRNSGLDAGITQERLCEVKIGNKSYYNSPFTEDGLVELKDEKAYKELRDRDESIANGLGFSLEAIVANPGGVQEALFQAGRSLQKNLTDRLG